MSNQGVGMVKTKKVYIDVQIKHLFKTIM